MSAIPYTAFTDAVILRTLCADICAHATALRELVTADLTGDAAKTALTAIRHDLDELEAHAAEQQAQLGQRRDETPYRRVHFRLNSGYVWGQGMSREKSENFYSEILSLFVDAGWTISQPYRFGSGAVVTNGNSSLYIHPQEVSGYVTDDLIPGVEDLLDRGSSFLHYNTDFYGTAYNWTAQEYWEYLNSKRSEIYDALLEAFKTPQGNLYKFDYNALPVIISRFHVQRLDGQNGHCTGDITEQVIREMFTALVNTGKIEKGETKRGAAYRTAPKRR